MREFGQAAPIPNHEKKQVDRVQIVAILNQADAGLKVAEVCRKHGIYPTDLLQLEEQIRRHEHLRAQARQRARG